MLIEQTALQLVKRSIARWVFICHQTNINISCKPNTVVLNGINWHGVLSFVQIDRSQKIPPLLIGGNVLDKYHYKIFWNPSKPFETTPKKFNAVGRRGTISFFMREIIIYTSTKEHYFLNFKFLIPSM